MPNQLNKFIVFTDLADYTLKSSLLTPMQLKEFIIDKQDEIILPLVKEYNWELVKYIWDSYLILFSKINDSVRFSINLQKKLRDHNKKVNLNLKKIELKIVINYWSLFRKQTKIWIDYFWDSLNIASRILDKAIKNKIFITQTVYDYLDDKSIALFLWDYNFKWLVYKVSLYELVFDKRLKWNSKEKLENNEYLNINIERTNKIDKLIFNISSVAFIITLQPVPFLDNYVLALLHLFLLKEIAFVYWIELSKEQTKEILSLIFLSIWGSYTTNQVVTWVWKVILPILWWYLLAPTNFALTYWIWKVFANYFYYKSQKQILNKTEIKEIFLWTKDKWSQLVKKQKNDVLETWKKYKDTIVKQLSKFEDIYQDLKWILYKSKKD